MRSSAESHGTDLRRRSAIRLRPVLPSHHNKYSESLWFEQPASLKHDIPALSFISGTSLPNTSSEPGWQPVTHPEGNIFYRHLKLQVVTYDNPLQTDIKDILEASRSEIDELMRTSNVDIENAEIFLSLATTRTAFAEVGYYLIDHAKRVPFWLHSANIERDLYGLEPFRSDDELALALNTEYWLHLESFPIYRPLIDRAVEELKSLLAHGSIDDITSPTSLAPWGADDTFRFLELLNESKDTESPYFTAAVARVWATISRVRLMNRYGLHGARVDRLQGLGAFIAGQHQLSLFLHVIELLCFNQPKRTFYQLSELWNGRLVYIRKWDSFLEEFRELCLRMAYTSGGITCLAVLLWSSRPLNDGILAAFSTGSIALLLSLYLYERHSRSVLGTATDVSNYLSRNESFQHGLRPLSIALSLPSALTIWSAIFLQIGLLQLVKSADKSHLQMDGSVVFLGPSILWTVLFLFVGGGSI